MSLNPVAVAKAKNKSLMVWNLQERMEDGLTKKLYENFWDDVRKTLISSITQAEKKTELSISQYQAVIKWKENEIQWKPLSLLNVDFKKVAKILSYKLQEASCTAKCICPRWAH